MFSEIHLPPRETKPSPYRITVGLLASRLDCCRASSGPLSPAPMLHATSDTRWIFCSICHAKI